MALKRLKIKAVSPATTKDGIPTVQIESDLVRQYIAADKQKKEAEDVMKSLRPELVEVGVHQILSMCTDNPTHPQTTVRVQDERDEVVQVQFTRTYGKVADVEAAEAYFGELKDGKGQPADINQFVHETIEVKFDNKVFYDAEGNYLPKVYLAFRDAVQQAALKLGVNCPLSSSKQIVPKETFHEERFKQFPTIRVQEELSEHFPNTVRVVPVTAKK